MGGHQAQRVYSYTVDNPNPHESQIYRNCILKKDDPLICNAGEGIDTCLKMFEKTCQECKDKPFLGTRKLENGKLGGYQWKTFHEIRLISESLARALSDLGILKINCPNPNQITEILGIYSKNREEWICLDLATMMLSATVVAFYDSLGDSSFEFICKETQLQTIALPCSGIPNIIKLLKINKLPTIKNLILFDKPDENVLKEVMEFKINILYYQDLIIKGEKSLASIRPPKPETIHTISYTSGTTGDPKGVMISHRNICSVISSAIKVKLFDFSVVSVYLSYLPLAHIYERIILSLVYFLGKKIGFYSGDPSKVIEDVKYLKPDAMVGVPRIYQRIYEAIERDVAKLSRFKRWLFYKALNSKIYYLRRDQTLKNLFYDKVVFAKVKQALGGNMSVFCNSAAPIEPELMDKFKVIFGCPFFNAYGQTESIGPLTVTTIDDPDSYSAGTVLPNCELKLIDVPEMNYFTHNIVINGENLPQGEVCFRGYGTFEGYFQNEKKTKEVIDSNGWAHTGDIGTILPGGRLRIIDRVKNIFKLSQGEYIAPEKIENCLAMNEFVSQAFVTGNPYKNNIVGILVPKKDKLMEYAKLKKINGDYEEICKNKEIINDVEKSIKQTSNKFQLNSLETLKNFILIPELFSIENDILTPTLKIKRHVVRKRYEKELEGLYSI